MKKTIVEELEEKYLRTVLVNENALLIYTESDKIENRIEAKLRYVERSSIQEVLLTTMSKEDYLTRRKELIEISEDRNAIAIYRKKDSTVELDRLYNTQDHRFFTDEFTIECAYQKLFYPESNSPVYQKKEVHYDKC